MKWIKFAWRRWHCALPQAAHALTIDFSQAGPAGNFGSSTYTNGPITRQCVLPERQQLHQRTQQQSPGDPVRAQRAFARHGVWRVFAERAELQRLRFPGKYNGGRRAYQRARQRRHQGADTAAAGTGMDLELAAVCPRSTTSTVSSGTATRLVSARISRPSPACTVRMTAHRPSRKRCRFSGMPPMHVISIWSRARRAATTITCSGWHRSAR